MEDKKLVNGKAPIISITSIAAAVLIAFGSLLWTHVGTVGENAKIAIDVARQHGREIQALREAIAQLHREIAGLQAQIALGGRFTREDGDRLENRMDRLQNDVDRVERESRPGTRWKSDAFIE